MNKFDKIYEKFLLEMPYIPIGVDVDEEHPETWEKTFDIEIEKYATDLNGLVEMFVNFLQGEQVKDKHGNVLQSDSHEERTAFMSRVVHNQTFLGFLRKYHNIDNASKFVDLVNRLAQNNQNTDK